MFSHGDMTNRTLSLSTWYAANAPVHVRTLEEFRARIIESTKSDDQVLVASFNRGDLGQTGSGHFAPISGYNTRKDMGI